LITSYQLLPGNLSSEKDSISLSLLLISCLSSSRAILPPEMSSKTQTHTFTHPKLGTITGLAGSPSTTNVVHFRSIPFASIPARFRQSVLLDHIPSSRTFTEYGTYCPSPVQDHQRVNVGGWLPGEEEKIMDETTCLNLTISAPRDALGGKGKALPVMVYVHGGAFTEGSGHISALHGTLGLSWRMKS